MNVAEFEKMGRNFKFKNYHDKNEILKKLYVEGRIEGIRIIGKFQNNEIEHYHNFLECAIMSNDFEYLRYLSTDEKFNKAIPRLHLLPSFNLEVLKILCYPNNQITEKTIIIFGRYTDFLLENCDLFDQFLSYKPKIKDLSMMIRRVRKINLDNWYKICNNYSECFNLIPNYTLSFHNINELIQPLICVGFGNKINLNNLSRELLIDNWFYLDLDNYFKTRDNFKTFDIFPEKPEIVFNICSNIISRSNEKHCFIYHKKDLEKIFEQMSETNKTIFRNLVVGSKFSNSYKKYLLNRTNLR